MINSNDVKALIENRAMFVITTGSRFESSNDFKVALAQIHQIMNGVQSIRSAPPSMYIELAYIEHTTRGNLSAVQHAYELEEDCEDNNDWVLSDSVDRSEGMTVDEIKENIEALGEEHWKGSLSILISPASQALPYGEFVKDASILNTKWNLVLSQMGEWFNSTVITDINN